MRTDVKVGLICGFVIVLALVIYFVLQQQNHPRQALASTSAAQSGDAEAAAAPVSGLAGTPGSTAGIPNASRQVAAGGAAAPGSPVGGAMIAPPGSPSDRILPPGAPADSTGGSAGGVAATAPSTSPAASGGTTGGTSGVGAGGGMGSGALTPGGPPPGMSGGAGGILPPPPSNNSMGGSSGGGLEFSHTPSSVTNGSSSSGGMSGSMGGSAPLMTGEASTYKIQKGDMLGLIAAKNKVSLKALQAANPGVDSSHLKIGQTINIPAPSAPTLSLPSIATAPTTKPAKTASTRSSHGSSGSGSTASHGSSGSSGTAAHGSGTVKPGSSYTVKKGDTLSTISEAAYGSKSGWQRIFRANRDELSDANDVAVGTVLQIPN